MTAEVPLKIHLRPRVPSPSSTMAATKAGNEHRYRTRTYTNTNTPTSKHNMNTCSGSWCDSYIIWWVHLAVEPLAYHVNTTMGALRRPRKSISYMYIYYPRIVFPSPQNCLSIPCMFITNNLTSENWRKETAWVANSLSVPTTCMAWSSDNLHDQSTHRPSRG